MRNEYEQLSPELPAFFQSVIDDRLVGLNLALTYDDFMFISRLDFQPLEEVPIVFSS